MGNYTLRDREFVVKQLSLAACSHYSSIFVDNEITEAVFRELTLDDLKTLLPGKLGPQKCIFAQVQKLGAGSTSEAAGCSQLDPEEEMRNLVDSYFTFGADDGPENSTLVELNKYKQGLAQEQLAKTVEDAQRRMRQTRLAEEALINPKPVCDRSKVPDAVIKQMKSLPIYGLREKLIKTIKNNQVVVIRGETGSGKSTQITQYLAEDGFTKDGKIGCTQPRRVAAKSVAKRVAVEFGVKLGTKVGYSVRFDKVFGPETIIKYMTDGMLINEFSTEPNLDAYSVIIIDEAHERSINTDVSLGLLKDALKARPKLRVIITSATLDCQKFAKYFRKAPIFEIPGKIFPIHLNYKSFSHGDYMQAAVECVIRIHKEESAGDILVFLTGEGDIETVCDQLVKAMLDSGRPLKELQILPCYGALPFEEQNKIFEPTPAGVRKVVVATNIAETSLTIDGIVYVVDSGYWKQKVYNPKTGIDTLVSQRITKAQADQRMGRAGRTKPGSAYRLYTKAEYDKMAPTPIPEIQRANVENVVLQLAALGVKDILNFDFLDPPPKESVLAAVTHLQELGALDGRMNLTVLGRKMESFPLDPPLAKVLIMSAELGCSAEMLKIVALLSTQHQNLFFRSKKCRKEADKKRAEFNQPEGDHLTFLKIYNDWVESEYDRRWCTSNYIQWRILEEAEEIRVQLKDMMDEKKLAIVTCYGASDKIQKAICSGFFRRVARKNPRGYGYKTYANPTSDVFLHPSCALFGRQPLPEWVIYHEVVQTQKAYMRGVIEVKARWIQDYTPPSFYKQLLTALTLATTTMKKS